MRTRARRKSFLGRDFGRRLVWAFLCGLIEGVGVRQRQLVEGLDKCRLFEAKK